LNMRASTAVRMRSKQSDGIPLRLMSINLGVMFNTLI